MPKVDKPNILFILADDLGWGDVSYHGSDIRTPAIDRLAESGIQLEQHYVCPMCTPTRVSFLTGRYPGRFGRRATTPSNPPVLPDNYETLATSLRNNGYDTGLFGKWHLGSSPQFGPNHFGFNTSYGSLAGGVDPYNHHYKRGEFSQTWHRNCQLIKQSGHVTDLITDEAIKWLVGREKPWFCYVPFTAVHVPIKAPQKWLDQYQFSTYDDDPLKDQSFKRYAAYTSQMDSAVGRLIEVLECLNQRDNTIIIFSSDNGAISSARLHSSDQYPGWQEEQPKLGSNKPFRGQKAQLYEGGIRTPTIINWRGKLSPSVCLQPLHIADWMPTLTNLADCKLNHDPKWDGVDIWPVIAEGEKVDNRVLFWNFKGTQFCLRQGNWKLITTDDMSASDSQLYHIESDPYETTDLSLGRPEIVKQLLDQVTQQRKLDGISQRNE
ncbi:MAG: sulfatase-like hydrolase/transferase [Candidatus Poribacteria bacterium]|nr:sulfatase-like hydrolase/transferase [Candidatus Poribacteria bacterium]